MRRWLIEKLGGYATKESVFETLESEAAAQLIKKLGGFSSIDDAIEALRDKSIEERQKILTLAVKKLFNTIGPDDILKPHSDGTWMFAGKTLSKADVEVIKMEAARFADSLLWKVLQKDVLYLTNRKIFVTSIEFIDVLAGKFWLYTFDTFRTRLNSIAAASALFNHKGK